jgi:hypothetical protein
MTAASINLDNWAQSPSIEKRRLQINLRVLRKSNFRKSSRYNITLLRLNKNNRPKFTGILYLGHFFYLNKYAGVYYAENQYLGHCISDEIYMAHLINWTIIYQKFDKNHRVFLLPLYIKFIYTSYLQLIPSAREFCSFILTYFNEFILMLVILMLFIFLEGANY